jgi:hypothetical protein
MMGEAGAVWQLRLDSCLLLKLFLFFIFLSFQSIPFFFLSWIIVCQDLNRKLMTGSHNDSLLLLLLLLL